MRKFPANDYNSAYSKATAEYESKILRQTIKEQDAKIKEQKETIERLSKELERVQQDNRELLEEIDDIEESHIRDDEKW